MAELEESKEREVKKKLNWQLLWSLIIKKYSKICPGICIFILTLQFKKRTKRHNPVALWAFLAYGNFFFYCICCWLVNWKMPLIYSFLSAGKPICRHNKEATASATTIHLHYLPCWYVRKHNFFVYDPLRANFEKLKGKYVHSFFFTLHLYLWRTKWDCENLFCALSVVFVDFVDLFSSTGGGPQKISDLFTTHMAPCFCLLAWWLTSFLFCKRVGCTLIKNDIGIVLNPVNSLWNCCLCICIIPSTQTHNNGP